MASQPARTLEEALGQGYTYLGRRDRTVAEMRAYLSRKAPDPELVEEAIAELSSQGYLDDERYARLFAEDRRRLDGWGGARIERRLTELGIHRDLAREASGEGGEESELEGALEVLRRRLRAIPSDDRARRRALDMLLRRGYEPELAWRALRKFEEGPAWG